jgi:hypothetical protein
MTLRNKVTKWFEKKAKTKRRQRISEKRGASGSFRLHAKGTAEVLFEEFSESAFDRTAVVRCLSIIYTDKHRMEFGEGGSIVDDDHDDDDDDDSVIESDDEDDDHVIDNHEEEEVEDRVVSDVVSNEHDGKSGDNATKPPPITVSKWHADLTVAEVTVLAGLSEYESFLEFGKGNKVLLRMEYKPGFFIVVIHRINCGNTGACPERILHRSWTDEGKRLLARLLLNVQMERDEIIITPEFDHALFVLIDKVLGERHYMNANVLGLQSKNVSKSSPRT